jgi:dipeptidyl aminopeptidase/acylaminoacyl peptidase
MRPSLLLFASAVFGFSTFPSVNFAAAATAEAKSSPWAVPPQVVIKQQDMTFTSAGAELSGTLYYPEGRRSLAAVVVLHGASEPSRDDAIYTHLKQMLPPLGIAVFAFDRRGTGKSGGGEHGKEDFGVLSDDGIAAFRMLIKDPRIDPGRVGFWGMSQGGGLSLLAAQKEPRAAFAIAVSPLISTADIQMNFASANIMRIKGYPKSEIDQAMATRHAIDDYDRGKIDRATVENMLNAAEHKPWFMEIYLGRSMIDPDSDWREQISANPMKSLNGSRVPTLLIFGQNDVWIPVGAALQQLQATRKLHSNITTRVISGATHEMMLSVDPRQEIDPASFSKFAPDAPEYFGVMSAWLGERGIARAELR